MYKHLLIKKIIDVIIQRLLKEFKLDKIQQYVEEPNELDKKVKDIEKKITKCSLKKI